MGFNVKKTLEAEKQEEIVIPLNVNVIYAAENGNSTAQDNLEVKHIMRIPTTTEREKQQQMLVKVRGQNVKAQGSSEANFWLWKQCMVRLEGYDELPDTPQQIHKMFEESQLLHIHAEKAAEALLGYINASEGDIAKK